VASWPEAAEALATRFWPGPLTLVLARSPRVPDEVTAGGPTVGIRVPAHAVATALLRAAGVPVAAPSANRFGRVSPTEATHVLKELGTAVDVVLDAGSTPLGIESTVVDLTGDRPHVLRPGGVSVEDLEAVVGPVRAEVREVVPESQPAAGPGRFLGHYAPETPVVLVEGDETVRWALIAGLRQHGVAAVPLDLPSEPAAAARALYAALRRADESGATVVLALTVEPSGLGRAVNDRLFRAAHGRVVAGADPSDVDRVLALVRP
jgi:L-threonylcarbamoyladenylate synthase